MLIESDYILYLFWTHFSFNLSSSLLRFNLAQNQQNTLVTPWNQQAPKTSISWNPRRFIFKNFTKSVSSCDGVGTSLHKRFVDFCCCCWRVKFTKIRGGNLGKARAALAAGATLRWWGSWKSVGLKAPPPDRLPTVSSQILLRKSTGKGKADGKTRTNFILATDWWCGLPRLWIFYSLGMAGRWVPLKRWEMFMNF